MGRHHDDDAGIGDIVSRLTRRALRRPELGSLAGGSQGSLCRAPLPEEVALFREIAEREPPTAPVHEFWAVIGRDGGKDSVASAIATVEAVGDHREFLRSGEIATELVNAGRKSVSLRHRGASRSEAKTVLCFRNIPCSMA
jgi:hypothetical protein